MQDNCFIENSFIKDIGFHHIKEWLSSNCNCEENKDYFNNLSPIYNISKLNNELLHTEELFKGLCRKDSLIEAKLKDISKSISSLSKDGEYIEIDKFSEIRNMLNYHFC